MNRLLPLILISIILVSGCIEEKTQELTGKVISEISEEVDNMVNQVHAYHILVNTEQEARDVLARLRNGESFDKVAQEVSNCPSGKKGGDLGWFGRGMMVRAFELAAFDLNKGDLSEPVKTQFGWHIIKTVDKK